MVMDMADSLLSTEDFVSSEMEKELVVNGCVFPQPGEGALICAGQPFIKVWFYNLIECESNLILSRFIKPGLPGAAASRLHPVGLPQRSRAQH